MTEPERPIGETAPEPRTAEQSETRPYDAAEPVRSDAADSAHEGRHAEHHDDARTTAVPTAPADTAVAPPAASAAKAPKRHSNRLVGTMWVLLAAGLFEVLYLAAIALIVALLAGAAVVGPQMALFVATPFAWLPVLFFFLLFELTVLVVNRAGRFVYVVASLVVGVVLYIGSVLLISVMLGGGLGDRSTLARAFEAPEFILIGLVAREVMLWTGFAIGARGKRVRVRDKQAKKAYEHELHEASDAR